MVHGCATLAVDLTQPLSEGAAVTQTFAAPPPTWGGSDLGVKVTGTVWGDTEAGQKMLVVVVDKIEYGTMSKELLFTAGCDYLTIEGLEQPESADDDDDEEGDEEEEEEYGGLLRLKVDHVKAAFGAPATFDFRFLKKEVEDGINPEHGLAPKDHNAVAVGYMIREVHACPSDFAFCACYCAML